VRFFPEFSQTLSTDVRGYEVPSELLFFCRRKRQVTVSGRFSQNLVSDDRSWEVPSQTSVLLSPKSIGAIFPEFSQKVVSDDRSWEVPNRLSHKSLADPKSARELLSVCSKLLRDEKKDLEESEEAIRILSSSGSKIQPELKKQRDL
jgi:hypothetical protein